MLDLSHADVSVGHAIPLSFPLSRGQRAAEPEYPLIGLGKRDAHSRSLDVPTKTRDLQVFFKTPPSSTPVQSRFSLRIGMVL